MTYIIFSRDLGDRDILGEPSNCDCNALTIGLRKIATMVSAVVARRAYIPTFCAMKVKSSSLF